MGKFFQLFSTLEIRQFWRYDSSTLRWRTEEEGNVVEEGEEEESEAEIEDEEEVEVDPGEVEEGQGELIEDEEAVELEEEVRGASGALARLRQIQVKQKKVKEY